MALSNSPHNLPSVPMKLRLELSYHFQTIFHELSADPSDTYVLGFLFAFLHQNKLDRLVLELVAIFSRTQSPNSRWFLVVTLGAHTDPPSPSTAWQAARQGKTTRSEGRLVADLRKPASRKVFMPKAITE